MKSDHARDYLHYAQSARRLIAQRYLLCLKRRRLPSLVDNNAAWMELIRGATESFVFCWRKRILPRRFTYTDMVVYMFVFDTKRIAFETVTTITLLIYYYPLVEAMLRSWSRCTCRREPPTIHVPTKSRLRLKIRLIRFQMHLATALQ